MMIGNHYVDGLFLQDLDRNLFLQALPRTADKHNVQLPREQRFDMVVGRHFQQVDFHVREQYLEPSERRSQHASHFSRNVSDHQRLGAMLLKDPHRFLGI